MAVLTNLASTLTARYFPSKTLTDAFYLDGRLFGKREARQADITIEKNERGYFLSVFAHPKLANYEPGMMPPYEPELRGTCNEVKFGHKEIDEMIEGFLTTAVDVTGKSRIAEADDRTPYFSGIIVRDSEAFAVTIGTGLAFLYRDDTLYPLTDAGIPMEPIDAKGNRVADFLYFCSSKTANALWSNFFTLAQDDCIILCNKEVYDALGQREILRILDEADDQCDAAGVIITQASARMPDVPMQFAISFVEDVVSDEKRGLFGFRKKAKEEDTSDMSIQSTLDGGLVGAAANAAAQAGFAGSMTIEDYQPQGAENSFVMFGDNAANMAPPAANQQATGDQGIVVEPAKSAANNGVQFLDPSVDKNVSEVSAEDVMNSLFADTAKAAAATTATAAAAGAAESIFVSEAVNPFASMGSTPSPEMQTVSTTAFKINDDADADKTKPVERLDAAFMAKLAQESAEAKEKAETVATSPFVAASYAPEVKPEPVAAPEPVVTPAPVPEQPAEGTFVFSETTESPFVAAAATADADSEFNPYSVGSGEEMQNAEPPVFGETGVLTAPSDEELISASEGIPVPEFDIKSDKPQIEESDKLGVEFPVSTDYDNPTEQNNENNQPESDGDFSLPFENGAETVNDIPEPAPEQIPEMPVYGANDYQAPTAAVNADVPADNPDQGVYSYGQMVNNENMADTPVPEAPAASEELDFGYAVPKEAAAPVQPVQPVEPVQAPAPDQSGYESLSPTAYGPYDEQPYVDGQYGYTPGQYQEGYDNPQGAPGEVPPSSDDDWINSILGIDDSAFDMAGAAAGAAVAGEQGMEAGGAAMAGNGAYGYNPQPVNQGVPPVQRRNPSSSANRPRTQSSGSGNGGGKRKVPRLNRNGYMFLAFVIVCLVCLIILISAIVRSCGKEDAEATAETEVTTATETMIPVETEPAVTTSQDPSYPIGRFQFSDYIGYRTWWDLFNTVYGIDDIANTSDARIQIILDYNGLDASYTPSNGDQLLLPPVGVLDGTIPVTFQVAGSTSADTSSAVSGEVQTVDGAAADPAAAETQAAAADEFVQLDQDPT